MHGADDAEASAVLGGDAEAAQALGGALLPELFAERVDLVALGKVADAKRLAGAA